MSAILKSVPVDCTDVWLSSTRQSHRFEAYSVGGGQLKWRVRRLDGWRRFLPARWTYGGLRAFDDAHKAFVMGPQP